MTRFLNGLIMAFTMYTIIPMPNNKWEEKNFPFILINLPIIGLIVGLLWYGVSLLIIKFNIAKEMACAIIMIFPLLLTGFIHIDGYMDTCDAIFSRASLEKKKEILKDSRVGAFAVIGAISLTLFYYSAILGIFEKDEIYLKALIFIPIFSRCITVLFVIKTKLISETGFIASFKKDMNNKYAVIVLLILIIAIVVSYFVAGKILLFVAFINIIFAIIIGLFCTRQLNGISGDLCGFIITLSSAVTLCILSII